ncbi:protein of unknown function [Burkholderia multivorans]
MTVTYLTLDQTIEQLVAMKAAGAPGKAAAALPVRDRNGRSCYVQRIEGIERATVAADEFEKGWGICKMPSRGVEAVLVY